MKYNVSFPPYYSGEIRSLYAGYADLPQYQLVNIDKESYIVKGVVENSDEGQAPHGQIIHNLHIGRYCSIAEDVYFLIGRGKNYKRVSTSSAKILHSAPMVNESYREKGSIIIENDVWIGRKVTIMSGVTVHNGAIIAANSHVVNDVPSYAIVGGNPAKVIGYRFEQEIIDRLQIIQWWYWSDEKIRENAKYFSDDIETFCDKFYYEAKEKLDKQYVRRINRDMDTYFMVVDSNDNYSILENVLDEFIRKFWNDTRKELILFIIDEYTGTEFSEQLLQITTDICADPDMKATISTCIGKIEDAKEKLLEANHLIINRMACTVELVCFAEMMEDTVDIISGVDSIIFQ